MKPFFSLLCTLLIPFLVSAESMHGNNTPITASRTVTPPVIDGRLDEDAWNCCSPVTGFIQRDPSEGRQATEATVVRLLYDESALYIGAMMYDSHPDSIVTQMGRRDMRLVSDDFTIYLDPYNDERSGYYFCITPSGCIGDGTLLNDDWEDNSWDGVWESNAAITDEGWSAEIKIPYSQLRFHRSDRYLWGVNFSRTIQRKNERVFIVYTPKDGSGFVSLFPDMHGIQDITPSRKVEIMPYFSTKAEYTNPAAGNPFNDGSQYVPNGGADIKVGIGNNLTLDGTINPDFGQVEVDPAVVNLTDVETFYSEKRPFFIEGSNIYNFGQGGSSSNFTINVEFPDFFYSRRIGRAPQGNVPAFDFISRPEGARILGAAKLSGKLPGDLNFGTMHAVTGRTMADVDLGGMRSEQEIEPQTYFGLIRGLKEFNDSRQGLGIIGTFTNRNFNEPALKEQLPASAAVAGLDGWIFLNSERDWVLSGWMGMSRVGGSRESMLRLQTNSQHYFQRPDAGHVQVDSSAVSLTGFAGKLTLNKQKGNMIVNAVVGFIDPGFEVNDMGFNQRTDIFTSHLITGYKWVKPGRFMRHKEIHLAYFNTFTTDRLKTSEGLLNYLYFRFINYWSLSGVAIVEGTGYSPNLTRGGPLMRIPGYTYVNYSIGTDSRNELVLGLGGSVQEGGFNDSWRISTEFEWKPSPGFALTLSPSYSRTKSGAQYVSTFPDPTAAATYGSRYVFASLDHTTLSASLRLNWTFSPRLSLQIYAQPLISAGQYSRFKELRQPGTDDFLIYGQDGSAFSETTRTADPDGDGPAAAISLPDPDFNFKSLRGNAVLRWEYRPGSTLYFVWTQRRSDVENTGAFQVRDSIDRLWTIKPDNIFMIKATYWFTL